MAHHEPPTRPVPLDEQVGLALRAYRRKRVLSQRALAEMVGVPQSTVARVERSALTCPFHTVLELLAASGHSLAVVGVDGLPVTDWDATDLEARDRSGRRFPAHHEVRPVLRGGMPPRWWTYHEEMGTGVCGPQPGWTAEGSFFPRTQSLNGEPRTRAPGEEPRWR